MRDRQTEGLLLSRLQQSNTFSSFGPTGSDFESIKAPLLSRFFFCGLLHQNNNASTPLPKRIHLNKALVFQNKPSTLSAEGKKISKIHPQFWPKPAPRVEKLFAGTSRHSQQ